MQISSSVDHQIHIEHNTHVAELKKITKVTLAPGYLRDACYISRINSIAMVLSSYDQGCYYQRNPNECIHSYSYLSLFNLDSNQFEGTMVFFPYPIFMVKIVGSAYVNGQYAIEIELTIALTIGKLDYVTIGLNQPNFIRVRHFLDLKLQIIGALESATSVIRVPSAHRIFNQGEGYKLLYSNSEELSIVESSGEYIEYCFAPGRLAFVSKEIFPNNNSRVIKIHSNKPPILLKMENFKPSSLAFDQDNNTSIYFSRDAKIYQHNYSTAVSSNVLYECSLPEITHLFHESGHLICVYRDDYDGGIEIYDLKEEAIVYFEKFEDRICFVNVVAGNLIFSIARTIYFINLKITPILKQTSKQCHEVPLQHNAFLVAKHNATKKSQSRLSTSSSPSYSRNHAIAQETKENPTTLKFGRGHEKF